MLAKILDEDPPLLPPGQRFSMDFCNFVCRWSVLSVSLRPTSGRDAGYCCEHVSPWICPQTYLRNHTSKLHQIFCPMYASYKNSAFSISRLEVIMGSQIRL